MHYHLWNPWMTPTKGLVQGKTQAAEQFFLWILHFFSALFKDRYYGICRYFALSSCLLPAKCRPWYIYLLKTTGKQWKSPMRVGTGQQNYFMGVRTPLSLIAVKIVLSLERRVTSGHTEQLLTLEPAEVWKMPWWAAPLLYTCVPCSSTSCHQGKWELYYEQETVR